MTKLFSKAFEKAKNLPENVQDEIAKNLLEDIEEEFKFVNYKLDILI